MARTRTRRTYDPRLRQLISKTGDIQIATQHGIPSSTARSWARSSAPDVVTLDIVERTESELRREVALLRSQNAKLIVVLRLIVILVKVLGVSLSHRRVPEGPNKRRLLRAVEQCQGVIPLKTALRILGLSSTRYHSWVREADDFLDDGVSCPHTRPQQLTPSEIAQVQEMVTSEKYRHVPTGTLAVLAQRLGKVFASPSTWYRLVRRYRWRRPRRRVHPAKPKIGIRAASPNEIWHIDTTVIRLLDGTRAYVHAVIDNFSRKILAWRASDRLDLTNTVSVLVEASRQVGGTGDPPMLLADSGVENVNGRVDELVVAGYLQRVLALTEIAYSNSLIEAWWRSLKHQWLFLNRLDSVATVGKLVAFYVSEHNSRLPHSAFRGQTPDEMYFGLGDLVPQSLDLKREEARAARLETNRSADCAHCRAVVDSR